MTWLNGPMPSATRRTTPSSPTPTKLVSKLLADGFNPIVFCRFIDTADYLAEHLEAAVGKKARVISVTGRLAAEERERRIGELEDEAARVLVATDCLSEGINLQSLFDAVVHYDLPWNPTRLEQREGRADRFGQPSPEVRVATIYGTDNGIDEAVLNVLLRKHRQIRDELGVSIPVPGSNDEFIETVFTNLFTEQQLTFDLTGSRAAQVTTEALFTDWDNAAEQERAARTRYAQYAIKTEGVAAEATARPICHRGGHRRGPLHQGRRQDGQRNGRRGPARGCRPQSCPKHLLVCGMRFMQRASQSPSRPPSTSRLGRDRST